MRLMGTGRLMDSPITPVRTHRPITIGRNDRHEVHLEGLILDVPHISPVVEGGESKSDVVESGRVMYSISAGEGRE